MLGRLFVARNIRSAPEYIAAYNFISSPSHLESQRWSGNAWPIHFPWVIEMQIPSLSNRMPMQISLLRKLIQHNKLHLSYQYYS
jgi:hypothetical protein